MSIVLIPNITSNSWFTLDGVLANGPTPALNSDGRMAVFVEGTDTTMWTIEQTRPEAWI